MIKRWLRGIAATLALASAWTATTGTVVVRRQSGVAPADWTPSFIAVWTCEEADFSPLDNVEGDANNDLTDAGGNVSRETANPAEDGRSCYFQKATGERFYCVDTTCTELDKGGTNQSWSYGAWTRLDSPTAGQTSAIIRKGTTGGGFHLYYAASTANLRFRSTLYKANGSGLLTTSWDDVSSGANQLGAWYHVVATISDPGATITQAIYRNSTVDATSSTASGDTSNSADDFQFNTGNWDGALDEGFLDDAVLTATEVARICSIGINGKRGRCDASDNTLYKGCNSSAECGGGICDTDVDATDDTYCTADTVGTNCNGTTCAGCCMGFNSACDGNAMPACNATR